MAKFPGFSRETIDFLQGLAEHNDKAWFDAHRGDYEAHYLEPAKAFVSALAPILQKWRPEIHAEPRVNGSIFRINRDLRFSRDKSPYKHHLDLWFWEGGGRSFSCPGLFFRLLPGELILGAGLHRMDKDLLRKYRAAILDETRAKPLARLLAKAEGAGYTVGGRNLSRVPRGLPLDHPRADLLRHDGLTLMLEVPLPRELHTADFPKFCASHFKAMLPLHSWLVDVSGGK
ncbi:MAG: DUF2461 domain-containing protein [Polyangiaceae bacterium]